MVKKTSVVVGWVVVTSFGLLVGVGVLAYFLWPTAQVFLCHVNVSEIDQTEKLDVLDVINTTFTQLDQLMHEIVPLTHFTNRTEFVNDDVDGTFMAGILKEMKMNRDLVSPEERADKILAMLTKRKHARKGKKSSSILSRKLFTWEILVEYFNSFERCTQQSIKLKNTIFELSHVKQNLLNMLREVNKQGK